MDPIWRNHVISDAAGINNKFSIYEPGSINSLVLGDGRPPTFNDGNPYFMGIFSPLRTWVDEFISLSPIIWKCHGS